MWIDDLVLDHCSDDFFCKVWQPNETVVVLGRSNLPEQEVCLQYTETKGIPVLQRKGGGGTVVLYPGCIIVSLGIWVDNYFENSFFFKEINTALVRTLESYFSQSQRLEQNGISDIISCEQKKIAGTSMFRSRGFLMYQASILGELDLPLVEKCLKHPSKEPDYRKGRIHSDFLTDLRSVFRTDFDTKELITFVESKFKSELFEQLGHKMTAAVLSHAESIKSRRE